MTQANTTTETAVNSVNAKSAVPARLAVEPKGPLDNIETRYAIARQKMEEHGLHVRHIRNELLTADGPLRVQQGGITVVYRKQSGSSFIELATSICSIDDVYSRKIGTALAVESFLNNQVIRIPNYNRTPVDYTVEALFIPFLTYTH